MNNKWLEQFKLALIEGEIEKMEQLHREMPEFETLEELLTAKALIGEALHLIQKERSKTKTAMDQVKRSMEFQKNALNGKNRFDESY